MFKLFDMVVLTEKVENIPAGTAGTIVEIWQNEKLYEIECFDLNHKTIDCITMKPTQFRKMSDEEIKKYINK